MLKRRRGSVNPNRKTMSSLVPLWDNESNGKSFDYSLTQGSSKPCHWFHSAECGCIHRWIAAPKVMTNTSMTVIGCGSCNGKGIPCCSKTSLVENKRFLEIKDEWDDVTTPSSY